MGNIGSLVTAIEYAKKMISHDI